jgi:hypothetical protein
MIYRLPNSIGSLFFNCPIRRTVTVKTHNIYKKQHGARPCVEKMQFIFFVPPNEELEYSPLPVFKLTMLVVMGTDCTGSCKFNYHTIMTMTAPIILIIFFKQHL